MMRFQALLSTVFAVSVSTAFAAAGDFVGVSAPVAFEKTTQVPGDTLKAGSYSISIVEQISDRMIVRIDSTSSGNHAIFLGVPSTTEKIGGSAGAVTWPSGVNKTPTVRGFVFPNGSAVEFVYPKAEAAALAKDNSAAVVAVDPQSEGRVALKSLSSDELKIVNLWLLSLTSTGPDSRTPAILARHYDPTVVAGLAPAYSTGQTRGTVTQAQAVPAPVVTRPAVKPAPVMAQQTPVATTAVIAQATPAPQPVARANRMRVAPVTPKTAPEVAQLETPTAPGVAAETARRRPAMAQLPHTAGSLPGVWLLGFLSLAGFAGVRYVGSSSRRTQS